MPFHLLRELLAAKVAPQRDENSVSTESQRDREAFLRLLADLTSRVPQELRETLQDALDTAQEGPTTGPELLDAIDRIHMGLGVEMGRGQAGKDMKYQQLGIVVAWLYEALEYPQDTQYAVVKRASAALKASERTRGAA